MANQDLVIPMLPRVAAPKPLPKEQLTVNQAVERPVIAEKWDQKNPISDDPSYQLPQRNKKDKQQQQQQQQNQASEDEQTERSTEDSAQGDDGHLDLYV